MTDQPESTSCRLDAILARRLFDTSQLHVLTAPMTLSLLLLAYNWVVWLLRRRCRRRRRWARSSSTDLAHCKAKGNYNDNSMWMYATKNHVRLIFQMLGKFEIFMCQPEKARASRREPPRERHRERHPKPGKRLRAKERLKKANSLKQMGQMFFEIP